MFIFEEAAFAPAWIKKFMADMGADDFVAFAMIRMYDADPIKYPSLRDKTEMVKTMLKGFGFYDTDLVSEYTATGGELHREFGFEAVGAQFVYNYKILWKRG